MTANLKKKSSLPFSKNRVVLIIITSIALRLLFFLNFTENPFLYSLSADEEYYLKFALNVKAGNWGLGSNLDFMDPLYGYFLGVIITIFGDNLFTIRLFQILIDASNVYLIFVITKILWGKKTGELAALIYCFYTPAFFYTTTLLKPILTSNFLLVWTLLSIHALNNKKLFSWFLVGVFSALCSTLRANTLILPFMLLLYLLLLSYRLRKFHYLQIFPLLAGLFIVLSISTYRNSLLGHAFSPLPNNGGIVLYTSFHINNKHGDHTPPPFVHSNNPVEMNYYFKKEASRIIGHNLNYDESNSFWEKNALRIVTSNPLHALSLILTRTTQFISTIEMPNNRSFLQENEFSFFLNYLLFPYGVIFSFGIPGIIILIKRTTHGFILAFPTVTIFTTCIIFFSFSRLRFPISAFLCIGTAIFFSYARSMLLTRQKMSYLIFIAVIVLIFFSFFLCSYEIKNDATKTISAYIKNAQFEKAEFLASNLLTKTPHSSKTHMMLGIIKAQKNETTLAIHHNLKAIKLNPLNHFALFNLAINYKKAQEYGHALRAISQAISIRKDKDYLLLKEEILLLNKSTLLDNLPISNNINKL